MQFVLAAGRLLRGAARAYVQTSLCEIIMNANRFIFCRSPTSADSEGEWGQLDAAMSTAVMRVSVSCR